MNTLGFSRRRHLGRASEDVLNQSIKDLELNKKPEEPKIIMCGLYEKDTELKAIICNIKSIDEFFFKTNTLTKEQKDLFFSATKIKYPSGALMYLARPYTINIGQIKLLYDQNRNSMTRCKVLDLFTLCRKRGSPLELKVEVLLIDIGIRLAQVPIENLYDLPQTISYYKDIEAEAKQCRIYFGPQTPLDYKDDEINQYFNKKMENLVNRELTIKILGYEQDIYHVDILNASRRSLVEHLRSVFRLKLEKCSSNKENEEIFNNRLELNKLNVVKVGRARFMRAPEIQKEQVNSVQNLTFRDYNGALKYFCGKLNSINNDDKTTSYLKKRFFRVKILHWTQPESIYIIPDDTNYSSLHQIFRQELDSYKEYFNDNPPTETESQYKIGDRCLFRYDFNQNVGGWHRGVIINVPHISEDGFIQFVEPYDSDSQKISDQHIVSNSKLYEVKSIDYGFRCVRSPNNLRHVPNDRPIFKKGPWALRCHLFGIRPLTTTDNEWIQPKYSEACIDMLDNWIKERILDDSKFSQFYLLFRTDLSRQNWNWDAVEPYVEVTLFHRYEPPYTIEDCVLPKKRKTRYDCLNTDLINRGVVSDCVQNGKESSRVELDHHIINLLVPHDRI